jgi:hypothetical protein
MRHKRGSDPHTEGRVLLAIKAFTQGQFTSIKAAATAYDAPYTTTLRRAQGRPPRRECQPNGRKLSSTEESALENWIISLDTRGFPPRVSAVRDMANLLLSARTKSDLSTTPPTVGENWARKFVNRHDTLKSRFSRKYDYQRAKNEDPETIRAWFQRVQRTIQEFGILEQDIYNFDETGFQMGIIATAKVITRAETRGRPTLIQPGNREWVTALETIRADGTTIPPMIIFAGKVHQSTWYDEKQLPINWVIGLSETGWTNDALGMIWLREVFDKHTRDRTIGRYRLLILDGHGSHLTPEFHCFCEDNSIILLCLPPHSSHLLQPLDVGCFSVLKRSYGKMVEEWIRLGLNHIDKQDFLTIYPKARTESQSASNIANAFRATGLVPYDPDQVLSRLHISFRTPTPPYVPSTLQSPFTAATPHDITQLQLQADMLQQLLQRRTHSPPSPTKQALDQIIKGCQIAMHNATILASENERLIAANERQKRKQSKQRSYIATEAVLTVEEGVRRVESRNTLGNQEIEVDSAEVKKRALNRCSMCKSYDHTARTCQQL